MNIRSNKSIIRKVAKSFAIVVFAVMIVFTQSGITSALSPEQKKIFQRGIGYYNVDECEGGDDTVAPGSGSPNGAAFPNLDPGAMTQAIDKWIAKENPNSRLKDMGSTIVAGAENSNVSPFLIVAIAKMESSLANPGDFNTDNANNAFGRTATSSQPNFQGAMLWYKWNTVKASVDHTAPENKNISGGGDIASYIREQYSDKVDSSNLTALFMEYAPPYENDTQQYISLVKGWVEEMVGDSGGTASASETSSSGGVRCCGSGGASADSLVGADNTEKAYNFFIAKGLTPEISAAIVGNFVVESGGDPLIPDAENGIGAYGIAQWLGGRKSGLESFAQQKGKSPDNLQVQLDYTWEVDIPAQESGGFPFLASMKQAGSIREKALIFEDKFERSGGALLPERVAAAQAVFTKYGSGGVSGGGTGSASGASCECPTPATAAANLNKTLKKLAEDNGGKTSVSVTSIDGSSKGNSDGDVQMPARSSYKIYTAYAVMKAVEENKIQWSTNVWRGNTLLQTMEKMIVESDNDAAEAIRLNNKIENPSQLTNTLQGDVGLSNKTVMGNGSASNPRGTNSLSSSNDFNKFLVLLEKKKLPGVNEKTNYTKLNDFMQKATTNSTDFSKRDGIVKGVGRGVKVADKPGWAVAGTDQATNDVGIVYLEGKPYAISILTDKAYPDWSGVSTIAKGAHEAMGGSLGDACQGTGDMTSTLKSYAWPDYSSSRSDPKPEYKKAFDGMSSGEYAGGGYTDCGVFVSRVMIDSGYEPDYNFGNKTSAGAGPTFAGQKTWLEANWQKVNVSSTKDLELGDVAISDSHTYLYIGKVDGLNGDSASASLGGRVPMASNYYDDGFTWYRK